MTEEINGINGEIKSKNDFYKELTLNSRVKRADQTGCYGTIKALKEESSQSADERKGQSLIVQVLWDNGTLSYFTPDALKIVSS